MKTLSISVIFSFALLAQFLHAQSGSAVSLTRIPAVDIVATTPTAGDLQRIDYENTDRIYIVKLYVTFPIDSEVAYLRIGDIAIEEYGSGETNDGARFLFFKVYSKQGLQDLFGESIRMKYRSVDYDLETKFPSEYVDTRTADELPEEGDALGDIPYGTWHGHQITEDFRADMTGQLGPVWVKFDPWVYSFTLKHWAYVPNDFRGWIWLQKN